MGGIWHSLSSSSDANYIRYCSFSEKRIKGKTENASLLFHDCVDEEICELVGQGRKQNFQWHAKLVEL